MHGVFFVNTNHQHIRVREGTQLHYGHKRIQHLLSESYFFAPIFLPSFLLYAGRSSMFNLRPEGMLAVAACACVFKQDFQGWTNVCRTRVNHG